MASSISVPMLIQFILQSTVSVLSYLYILKYFRNLTALTSLIGSYAALPSYPVTQGADQHEILSVDDKVFHIAILMNTIFSGLCLSQLELGEGAKKN